MEARHDAEQHENIDRQREYRDHTSNGVVSDHEARNQCSADERSSLATRNGVLCERRTNLVLLSHHQWQIERIVKGISDTLGFCLTKGTRDLRIAAVNGFVDIRRRLEVAI